MAVTEHTTVLFTDLVGSTELATSLAPEVADELRHGHFSALRQAIAATGGTEVKNLGDGLMVAFPAASAALGCAVAMQQAVYRDNAGSDRPLGLRVGLSAGESTKEGEDYFGDPVIEAARLCARAEGGQILASDIVRVTAGRRSPYPFTSLGELDLKGLPEPVETLEVGWEPLDADAPGSGRVPLPTRLTQRPTIGVIGRENELAILDSAAKRVGVGEGRELFLLTGEPGQGKTTLVSEVARHAHDEGMTVILGRCDEEMAAPYRPFHEALSHLVAHVDEELLRTHVARHGGELARMVPALGRRLGELPPLQTTDSETERYLLYAAVVGVLEEAAQQRPVVLVLDDLHWADKPSLQLLRYVMANSSDIRLLILGTYRDGELSAAHPLTEALAALHREPAGVSTIDLKGLEDTGVIAFMESAAGHELDDAGVGLAHQLYRETDGNPFFVAEMLRHLSESGEIFQDATGRWTAKETDGLLTLPHSVRTVIGTRVSRLGEGATKVLSTASVIGRDFDLDLLAETTKVDEDELIALLEEAQHAAVVSELPDSPGRYSFSHALVQHTLYEDLGTTRRTRVHHQVGEALERLCGSRTDERVGELARHFLLATRPSDADKAFAYARQAGEVALCALAPDDAARYFTQALDLAGPGTTVDPPTRIDLLIGLGTAQRQAGIPDFRSTLLEAARRAQRLGDTQRLVEATLANNRGFVSSIGQIDIDRVEMLEAALETLPESHAPHRARLLSRLSSELAYGPFERRFVLAREAKAAARSLGDAATLVDVIADCFLPLHIQALDEELADCKEALAIAEILDDPVRLFWALVLTVIAATRAGEFELADTSLARQMELAQRLQQPTLLWTTTWRQAAHALLQGDAAVAEELATSALDLGSTSGQPDAYMVYGFELMSIRRYQGRIGELLSVIADSAVKNPGFPVYRAVLASAYLDTGDDVTARRLIDEAAVDRFELPKDPSWLDAIVCYARPAIELGLVDAAQQLFEMLAPYHGQVPYSGVTSHEAVDTVLGGLATVLGRYDEAEAYFTKATDLNTRGHMRLSEVQTQLFWGRMLLARNAQGDAARAHEMLMEARSGAAQHNYALVERRASSALAEE